MKREREKARVEKRKEKAAKRSEKSQHAVERPRGPGAVDPDIADISVGPQPPAEWQIDAEEKASSEK
jgi:hypothetical protein